MVCSLSSLYIVPLQIAERGQALGDNFLILFARLFRFEVAKLFQSGKDAGDALFYGLFIGLNDQFRMLRLLVGVIDAGETLDFALIYQFVQALDIALAADFDRAFDVDFDEIADLLARPLTSLAVGRDGGRNTGHTVARQQAAHEGDALDVGIAILAAEAQALAQMRAHHITIQNLYVATARLQTLLDSFRKRAFAGAGEAGKPDCETGSVCHVYLILLVCHCCVGIFQRTDVKCTHRYMSRTSTNIRFTPVSLLFLMSLYLVFSGLAGSISPSGKQQKPDLFLNSLAGTRQAKTLCPAYRLAPAHPVV